MIYQKYKWNIFDKFFTKLIYIYIYKYLFIHINIIVKKKQKKIKKKYEDNEWIGCFSCIKYYFRWYEWRGNDNNYFNIIMYMYK